MRACRRISRNLLVAGAALFLMAASGSHAKPRDVAPQQGRNHHLLLYNTHTGERIEIVYRRGDQYIPDALAKLDYFLRDHRTGDVRHFDPRLYDILADLTASVGHPGGEIDIVCGYRTPCDERISSRSHHRSRQEQPSHSSGSHRPAHAWHRHAQAAQGGSGAASRRRGLLSPFRLHPRRRRPCPPVVFRAALPGLITGD